MNKMKTTLFSLLVFFASAEISAQDLTIIKQTREPDGSMIAASSTNARKVHVADDFIFTTDATIKSIKFEGSQIYRNLDTILQSVDFLLIESDDLTQDPTQENVVYKSLGNLDGVELFSEGFKQNFEINLENKNVRIKANTKYWIVFGANIDAAIPTSMGDWHNYPGYNTVGTSLAKKYTNNAWTNEVTGLTFEITGESILGTTEVFKNDRSFLKSTLVTDVLRIDASDFKFIEIFDISGKRVLISDKTTVSLNNFISGTYIAVLKENNGRTRSAKFIKK